MAKNDQAQDNSVPAPVADGATAPATTAVAAEQTPAFMVSLDKFSWQYTSVLPAALGNLQLVERRWRYELGPMLAVFCFAFALYGITTPRLVTLEDDGLFLMNLEFLGVGHPPGYPLFSLLGSLFFHSMPEFLPPAMRGHLFSSFCGAIACVAIYAIVAMLVRGRVCALAAGMAFAASEAFWSQAIIAEVYTPNAAFYFTVLAMCMRYASHTGPGTLRHLLLYAAIALVYGLGMSVHWPLLGLGSICLLLIVVNQWRTLLRRIPIGAVCLAVGLLPYVWMIIRSGQEIPLNFYGKIGSLKELWFYVTRSGYAGVDQQSGVGWEEKVLFTQYFTGELMRQITIAGLVISGFGVVAMLRSAVHFWLAISLLLAWFMSGPMLIIMLDFKAEFIWFSAFRVYHLLCYGITVIFFGYGLGWIGEWAQRRWQKPERTPFALAGIGTVVVAASLLSHWHQNDRSDYDWAHNLAVFKLLAVESNARLFTFDDLDLPVGYVNYVERVRPDVIVYNDQGLVFGNRVYSPFTSQQQRSRQLSKFIQDVSPLPVYYHAHRAELFRTRENGSDFLGFWRRVNRDGSGDRVVLADQLRLWIEDNLDVEHLVADRWTKQNIESSVATLVAAVQQAVKHGYVLTPEWEAALKAAREKNQLVHLFLVWDDVAAGKISMEQAAAEIAWVDNMFGLDDLTFNNGNWAQLLLLKVRMMLKYPDLAQTDDLATEIEEVLLEALDYDFSPEVFNYYADYLRGQRRHRELINMLKDQLPAISNAAPAYRDLYNLLLKEEAQGKLLRPVITLPTESSS